MIANFILFFCKQLQAKIIHKLTEKNDSQIQTFYYSAHHYVDRSGAQYSSVHM